MTTYLGAFNNHLAEFIDDLIFIFPDDSDIKMAKTAFYSMKSINPAAIVKLWHKHMSKYKTAIDKGDISFFIKRDYANDIETDDKRSDIQRIINNLRGPVSNMGADNQLKAMKYIQNLTSLSDMYMNQK